MPSYSGWFHQLHRWSRMFLQKVDSCLPATQRYTAEDCSLKAIRILKSHNFHLITKVHEWKDYGSLLLSCCINRRGYQVLNEKRVTSILRDKEKAKQEINLKQVESKTAFLLILLFNGEDGGNMCLQNVGWHLTGYMALYPRRQNSSKINSVETIFFK